MIGMYASGQPQGTASKEDHMKAIIIREPGGPEKLELCEVPLPEIKPGWSLVKIAGFGINHSEIFTRKGLSPSVLFPRIPGIECVGIIEKSSDESVLHPGQRAVSIMGEMGRAFDGGYAEYALLPNEQIYPIRSSLPWAELAALPETGYTAYGSLLNLKIQPGDKVLVRGASSGVGLTFMKMIKARWPEVHIAGSCRSLKKKDRLLREGFDEVILEADGKLDTEEKFDKILELVGPASFRDTFAHTNEGGIVCFTGQLGGVWEINGLEPIMELPPNSYLTSFYSGNVSLEKLQEMFDFAEKYKVPLKPEKVFSLEQVPEAHAYLEGGQAFGKVVVII